LIFRRSSSQGRPEDGHRRIAGHYGVGYVARPIGAFVLGHWGDTQGRKHVLIVCMFLMGFSTVAVGLLPTYDQVGLLAPALLVILRLIQGFAWPGRFPARAR
jgi:MFS family permease